MKIKVKKAKSKWWSKLSPERGRINRYVAFSVTATVWLAIILWYLIISPTNETAFEQGLSALATKQQQAASQFLASTQKKLTGFAQHSQTILAAAGGDKPAQFFKLQQDLEKLLPNTLESKIFLPGEAQKIKDQDGPISYAQLSLINRVEKNTEAFPEIARISGAGQWKINWALPIVNKSSDTNQSTLAIIYVSTSIEPLQQVLSSYDLNIAKTQLEQRIQRQAKLDIFTVGQGGDYGKKTTIIPDSHWQLSVFPSKRFVQSTSISLWYVIFLLGLGAGGIVLAGYLAGKKNKRLASLYSLLNNAQTTTNKETTEAASPPEELSNPLFFSDEQLDLSEEDQALVTGANQQKRSGSEKPEPSDGEKSLEQSVNESLERTVNELFEQPANEIPEPPSSESEQTGKALEFTPAHIFRAYDIRGLVNPDLTLDLVERIGKAIATEALEQGEKTLLLGRDAREHSPVLYESLQKGVISTGCHVIDIGLVPTPLLNFATTVSEESNSGVIVTASHNPKEYNGFKIVLNGRSLVKDDIDKLYRRVSQGLVKGNSSIPGQVKQQTFTEDYVDAILTDIAIYQGMQVVVDTSNGAASELAPRVFRELGCQVTELYCDFDGQFPNHDPDPSNPDNLQDLIAKVKELNADVGVALDGDGDRLVVVTTQGTIIWPDQLLILFAQDVVSRNPGCDVVFDIKCTRLLGEVITRYGGRPIMWKTGHSNIKEKMRETEALLGGEFSGHIFFKERWFGFDDGLYAAARLLEIISLREQSLDEMVSTLPQSVSTSEIRIEVDEDLKFRLVNQLIDQGDFMSGEKTAIDGLRVDFTKGWGLIRASNTEPALTLRFEANSDEALQQLKTLFKRELAKLKVTTEF